MAGEPNERPPLHPSARSSARLGLGEVDIITPGLIHVRLAGAIRPEHIESIMRAGDEQIANGYRVLMAVDADDVHAYKSEVRQIFQSWLRQNRDNVEKVWMLFRSPLLKMGVGLANAFTGGMIRSFSDPEEFDAELSKATSKAKTGWLLKDASAARQ
jgi:hypothetical protein